MIVQAVTIAEIKAQPNLDALIAEYAKEAKIGELPSPCPQWETYQQLEDAGVLKAFAGFVDGVMGGFLVVLSSVFPHYGKMVSSSESWFVASEYRRTGMGNALLRLGESHALAIGSQAFMVSAPTGGKLASILDTKIDYRETNRVFFKDLRDA